MGVKEVKEQTEKLPKLQPGIFSVAAGLCAAAVGYGLHGDVQTAALWGGAAAASMVGLSCLFAVLMVSLGMVAIFRAGRE